jgi:hypothetical protein
MQRSFVVGLGLYILGLVTWASPVGAQTTLGADLGVFSSYVWRGRSLTNKPVAEPNLHLTIPVGNASITFGGWANVDLGKYDNLNSDISESGGSSSFNLSEVDPYAEVSFPVGKTTLTGGVLGYIYPNDISGASNGGFNSDANTAEIYGKAALKEVPLSPRLAIYYDVDKIKGAYLEGSISHSFPAREKVSVDLGALAGFSAGQGASDNLDESSNFFGNGLTHVDVSGGLTFTAGSISVAPALHLVINSDEATKVTSPSNLDKGAKVWFGTTLSWSKPFGAEPETPKN